MQWNDFLRKILSQETVLDNLVISLSNEPAVGVPPILKASVIMTDKFIASSRKNMFVFPELQICSFVFMLLRTLYYISEGRIKKDYDPYAFIPGCKLKYKNSVMEFVGIVFDKDAGVERIWVRFADMKYSIPLEAAPFLQHVETKRLSKLASFKNVSSSLIEDLEINSTEAFIRKLSDYKTHLDGTALLVAPVLNTKKLFSGTTINGESINDVLLLAQADLDGKVKNMAAGQLKGNPAIVLCPDLYTANEIIESSLEIKSVIVEANEHSINNQLDALDELIKREKPIMLLTDHMSYTDTSNLESRGFNIWTWNESTITADLYGHQISSIGVRAYNVAQRKIEFIEVTCPEISRALDLLNKTKTQIEDKAPSIRQAFQNMFEIALLLLRAVTPIKNYNRFDETLRKCNAILEMEKPYINTDLFADLSEIVVILDSIFRSGHKLPKIKAITSLLLSLTEGCYYLIVPPNADKNDVGQYIDAFLQNKGRINVTILYPNEYTSQPELVSGFTIVSCWLNRVIMNRILNSYTTPIIKLLLYEPEKLWKNGYFRNKSKLSSRNNSNNAKILNVIGSELDARIDREGILNNHSEVETQDMNTLEEIELTLKQSKYRHYFSSHGGNSEVKAIPISFVGDYLAFYRTGRTLLTATKLINEDYEKIEEIKAVNIKVGDFVIERETQRDLTRDIADVILRNGGCLELRDTSRKWKEALEVESVFSDENTIYEKLRDVGCTRSRLAVRLWLNDNNMITPQSKDDIAYIAEATGDTVLSEIVDNVFEAGRVIKSAHIQAGHHLAQSLKSSLASSLTWMGSIDSFNVWDPIEVSVENVGNIKILKVIDVGAEIIIDAANTNRLLNTNRIVGHGG